MAGLVGGGGGGGSVDYVQDTAPSDPSNAEQWVDTSSDPFVLKMWNAVSGSWDALTTFTDHNALETNFDNHTSDGNAHHSRYSDAEARNAAKTVKASGSVDDYNFYDANNIDTARDTGTTTGYDIVIAGIKIYSGSEMVITQFSPGNDNASGEPQVVDFEVIQIQ